MGKRWKVGDQIRRIGTSWEGVVISASDDSFRQAVEVMTSEYERPVAFRGSEVVSAFTSVGHTAAPYHAVISRGPYPSLAISLASHSQERLVELAKRLLAYKYLIGGLEVSKAEVWDDRLPEGSIAFSRSAP